jgi:transposase-like protein
MKYKCKECQRTFQLEKEADSHESETGHKVELLVGSTYWGQHLVAQ